MKKKVCAKSRYTGKNVETSEKEGAHYANCKGLTHCTFVKCDKNGHMAERCCHNPTGKHTQNPKGTYMRARWQNKKHLLMPETNMPQKRTPSRTRTKQTTTPALEGHSAKTLVH